MISWGGGPQSAISISHAHDSNNEEKKKAILGADATPPPRRTCSIFIRGVCRCCTKYSVTSVYRHTKADAPFGRLGSRTPREKEPSNNADLSIPRTWHASNTTAMPVTPCLKELPILRIRSTRPAQRPTQHLHAAWLPCSEQLRQPTIALHGWLVPQHLFSSNPPSISSLPPL